MNRLIHLLLEILLGSIEAGYYPQSVFEEFCRLNTVCAIEIVPFTKVRGRLHVLMLKRPQSDIHWPGMWHTPGAIIRPTDTLKNTIYRVLKEEIGVHNAYKKLIDIGPVQLHTKRGNCVGLCYAVMLDKSHNCMSFSVTNLPDNVIGYQKDLIKKAIKSL